MAETVSVIGHKNPDTDSVASAIAYSYLKNELGKRDYITQDTFQYVPVVLGPVNSETRFVIEYFGVETPKPLNHIKIRAKDGMSSKLIAAAPRTSLLDVGDMIYRNNIRSLPVVDEEGFPIGIVTERNIAHRYIEEVKIRSLANTPVSAKRIVETLNGKIIMGDPNSYFSGDLFVAAMEPGAMAGYLKEGDLVIIGNREDAQEAALKKGIACLVITGNFHPSENIIHLARERQAVVMITAFDTFATAKLINLSIPIEGIMERDFLRVNEEELFSEIVEDVLNSENRLVLVVDSDNRLVGIITRQDLVHPMRRKAILVDHNEISQSILGIEEAQIMEIIDHHRLGDIQTGEPILVINEPVGATSTIIYKMFKEEDILIPKGIAGIMLAAIISDTVLMKSPTTTEEDRKAAMELAEYINLDSTEFGIEMYRKASNIDSISARDIVLNDLKNYEFNEYKLGVGQIETIDANSVLKRKSEILEVMNRILEDKEYHVLILMVTDILREGTELLIAGKSKVVEKAFEKDIIEGSVFLPGVISRKKQVAPPLAKVLAAK